MRRNITRVRFARVLTLTVVLIAGCSDDGNGNSVSTTSAGIAVDVTDACTFLSTDDFAAVGFTVDGDPEDVSDRFSLSTTSSVACQWMTSDDNISSSWELVIGSGGAEAAYALELSFAAQDTITTVDLGGEAFLADIASSFDSADHDFEVGVRIDDTFFTLSTTDDRGAEAIVALTALVADQLGA